MNRPNAVQLFLQERLGLDALQGLASKKRVPFHRARAQFARRFRVRVICGVNIPVCDAL